MREQLLSQEGDSGQARWARAVLDAVEIDGSTLRRRRTHEATPRASAEETVAKAARWLYNDVHLGGTVSDEGEAMSLIHPAWASLLASAHHRYVSTGWVLERTSTGEVHASRGPIELRIRNDQLKDRIIGDGILSLDRFRPNGLFGWHTFPGCQGGAAQSDIRLYLPDLADAARLPAFVRELDKTFARWSGKVAANAETARPDRLVIYTDEKSLAPVIDAVKRTRAEFGSVDAPTPGFAEQVVPGVFGARAPSGDANSHGASVAERFARILVGQAASDSLAKELHSAMREVGVVA